MSVCVYLRDCVISMWRCSLFGIYDVNRLSYLSCLIDQDMGISLKFVLRRSILRLMLLFVVKRSIVKIDAFVCFV